MALSRAIEARRPIGERVCDDPLAERFLGPRYRWALAIPPLRLGVPMLGGVPSHVALVPVDFNRDRLSDALDRAGFRASGPSIVLWEGTVPYLSPEAASETLRFIASTCGAGSRLFFDYVVASVLDGTCSDRGAATEYARMKQTAEPFVFGIAPEHMGAFLSERGFRDVRDIGGDELRDRCFPMTRRNTYVKPWWRIVQATVR
jgi:O-methyltransferase involved in polyketide biosynthesis